MRNRTLAAILIFTAVALLAVVTRAGIMDDDLEQFIPEDRWFDLGLSKLSSRERDALALEIRGLVMGDRDRRGDGSVAVIAPSYSTEEKAKAILKKEHLKRGPMRRARRILVVVRSTTDDPLEDTYKSVCELTEDAESQFNLIGEDYHIYYYLLKDDLGATLLSHKVEPDE